MSAVNFKLIGLCLAVLGHVIVFGAFAGAVGAKEIASEIQRSGTLAGNYLAGRYAQNRKDLGTAAYFIDQALKFDPDNEALVQRSFVLHLADGQVEKAVPLAAAVKVTQPNEPIANAALVAHLFKIGDYAAAESALAAMGSDGINRFLVPILRAWSLYGLGLKEEAIGALTASKAYDPAIAPLVTLHIGMLRQQMGQPDKALEAFKEVLDGPSGMSFRLAEMIGEIYHSQGRIEEARATYEAYKQGRPGSRLLDKALASLSGPVPEPVIRNIQDGVAEAFFDIATSLRQQNARETGLVFGQLGLYLRPDHGGIKVLIAEIAEIDGRLQTANDLYRQVPETSPFWWDTQLRLAVNLSEMEKTDAAIDILNNLGEADPKWTDPIINLGDILRRAERYDEAIKAYNDAEKRIGELEQRHWPLLYARGIALERAGRWPEAEENFLRALDFEASQPYVLNYLGYSWVEKNKNLDQALTMIQKAVSLRPNDGYIVDSLGWVYYQLGDYENAVTELERAVELRPQDPVINDHLGDALWRVGREFEATFQWRRALSFEPEDELTVEIKKKLKGGLAPEDG